MRDAIGLRLRVTDPVTDEEEECAFGLAATPFAYTTLCLTLDDLSCLDDAMILGMCHWFIENGADDNMLTGIVKYPEICEGIVDCETEIGKIEGRTQDPYVLDMIRMARSGIAERCKGFGSESVKKVHGRERHGWVYVLRADNGTYKIGQTMQLQNRVTWLGIQLPYETEVVATIVANDPRSFEAALHRRFEDKRLRGEWFELDDGDLRFIKDLNLFVVGLKGKYAPGVWHRGVL